jgi:rhodanese-related sulfurtransferase
MGRAQVTLRPQEFSALTNDIRRIDARHLKVQLHDGEEIAVLDAREEGVFARRHHLLASCVPLSRLELLVDDLVPRRTTRVVWCDDGDGTALLAARRMAALGYQDVAVLEGGIAAWETAGYRLYSGVHVPSKAFAEVVEREAGTPWISAPDLKALIDSGADIAIFDSRSYEEYHNNSIPTAISVPGAELVYRFADLTPSPDTTVIVNCGGRTRSIIGAQILIDAGLPNKVLSLKDGTQGWHLAGLSVARGQDTVAPPPGAAALAWARQAAAGLADRFDVPVIDAATLARFEQESNAHTLYRFDVRVVDEYRAGHRAGFLSAPGGQLVQATDTFIAVRRARIVLADTDGVRARTTAAWLARMGFPQVFVLDEAAPATIETGAAPEHVLGLDAVKDDPIDVDGLADHLRRGAAVVVDVATSRDYRAGHIPGAWFAVRGRLAEDAARLPAAALYVLTSPDGVIARLAAHELAGATGARVRVLSGGTEAWRAAGQPLEVEPERLASRANDVFLKAFERTDNREAAMREYLQWEVGLVEQVRRDGTLRFRL